MEKLHEHFMKGGKIILSGLLVLFVQMSLLAQTTVTGTITDSEGEALIGASVIVQGTGVGTVSDFDGNYELSVPEGSTALVFSYTGFSEKVVALEGFKN